MIALFGQNMQHVANKTMRFFFLCGARAQIGRSASVSRFIDHTQLDTHTHTPTHTYTYTHTHTWHDSSEQVVTRSPYLHNTQQTKQTNIHTLSGIRTSDRAISDLHLGQQGHRERSVVFYGVIISQHLSIKLNGISYTIKLEFTVHVFRDFRGSYTSVLYIYYSYYLHITQTNCFYRKRVLSFSITSQSEQPIAIC
jgi:hypothetical protein